MAFTEEEKIKAREILRSSRSVDVPQEEDISSSWEAFDKKTANNEAQQRLVSNAKNEQEKDKSLLGTVGSFFTEGKGLKVAADMFVNPFARELERPAVSVVRAAQSAIPGGKTGKESANTPFGEVKPYSELTPGEAAMGALEVVSNLPGGKVATGALEGTAKVGKNALLGTGEKLTAVERPVLERWFKLAKENPERLQKAKEMVKEFPEEPMKGVVGQVATRLNEMRKTAQDTFAGAKETFERLNPIKKFDVSHKVAELDKPLKEFGLKVIDSPSGKLEVGALNKITSFSKKELGLVSDLVTEVKNGADLTLNDLISLRKKFSRAYDAVPLGLDGQPTEYHALVKTLEDSGEKIIHDALPDSLKEANNLYSQFRQVMGDVGSKIVDGTGNVKAGAESFLSNAMNLNKGVVREGIGRAEQATGLRILDSVQDIKDAQKMVQSVPHTVRSRFMDVLRNAAGWGAGAGVATGNLAAALPSIILEIFTRPDQFGNLIEAVTKTSKKLPVSKVIKQMSPEEQVLIQNLVKGLVRGSTSSEEGNYLDGTNTP